MRSASCGGRPSRSGPSTSSRTPIPRASPAAQRLISDTLLGAAADRDRARELRAGHLTQELPAPGFEVLTGAPRGGHLRLVPPSVREARSGKAERQAKAEQENERRRRDAEDRKRQAAEQQSVIAGLEREAEELARKLIAARERVREAQRESKARRRPPARPGEGKRRRGTPSPRPFPSRA